MCKVCISAHHLRVETERHKRNPIYRSQRICKFCNHNVIEDEEHFITQCPSYENLRQQLFLYVTKNCRNFANLDDKTKFTWLMTTEDNSIIQKLCHFLIYSLKIRSNLDPIY